ncbi:MAG: hypothetical protein NVS3B26_18150 [Mycobacteriales bacterium]
MRAPGSRSGRLPRVAGRWLPWGIGVAVLLVVVLSTLQRSAASASDAAGAFALALFAALLTGEAVVFALSFDARTAWPSLREIDQQTAFRAWVVVGTMGAIFLTCGVLGPSTGTRRAGADLVILADLLGVSSFLELFGLASAEGRQRLLRRTVVAAVGRRSASTRTDAGPISADPVLRNYFRELDAAMSGGNSTAVEDLTLQIVHLPVPIGSAAAVIELHFCVLQRTYRGALLGVADPPTVARSIVTVTQSLIAYTQAAENQSDRTHGAVSLAQLGRTLAWLGECALTLHVRGDAPRAATRELISASLSGRDALLRAADPEPVGPSTLELGTPFACVQEALMWTRCFTEYHGSYQAAAMYGVYQVLTGKRFTANFFDGALLIQDLRAALLSGNVNVDAWPGDVDIEGFDMAYLLASSRALSLYRDATRPFPEELARPDFQTSRQQMCINLRMFAGHRFVSTSAEALAALASVYAADRRQLKLWHATTDLLSTVRAAPTLPLGDAPRSVTSVILGLALRLAPTEPAASARELESFLKTLPDHLVEATARLTRRVIPHTGRSSRSVHARTELLTALGLVRETPSNV